MASGALVLLACSTRSVRPVESTGTVVVHTSDGPVPDARLPAAPIASRVTIAAGVVQVGRVAGDQAFEENPPRAVRFRAFAIDRDEVSAADYARCVTVGRCRAPACDRGAAAAGTSARCVGWDDARRYCAWTGGRLPTETEWERAAAGALPGHRAHAWGDAADGADVTPDGVCGLSRGVAEWVIDGGAFYLLPVVPDGGVPAVADTTEREMPGVPADDVAHGLPRSEDARSVADGPWRTARGGHDADTGARPTSSRRRFRRATDRLPWIGFRCAADVDATVPR